MGIKREAGFILSGAKALSATRKYTLLLLAHNSVVISFTVKIHSFSQETFIFDFTAREIFNSTLIGKQNVPKIELVVRDSAEYFQKEQCSTLRSSERNLQKQSKVPLLSPPGGLFISSPFEDLILGGH